MSGTDLTKTMGYDVLRRDGARVLQKTLLAADREMIDGDIQRDLDQLMVEVTKGIRLGGGKMGETVGLVRLVGYLQEMSLVIGMLPAFGFSFRTKDDDTLQLVFDPRRLEHLNRVPTGGLGRVAP